MTDNEKEQDTDIQEENEFFEREYQVLNFEEKFAYWVKDFAADSRIWSIHPVEQFHLEFFQHIQKYSPEGEGQKLVDALSLYWHLPIGSANRLIQLSYQDKKWNDLVEKTKSNTNQDIFISDSYTHFTNDQKLKYWRLKFAYFTSGFSYHPYELIHLEFKNEFIDFEGNSYLKLFTEFSDSLGLDIEKSMLLLDIDENDPENEYYLEKWIYSKEKE